jgi:hypothetical protein
MKQTTKKIIKTKGYGGDIRRLTKKYDQDHEQNMK